MDFLKARTIFIVPFKPIQNWLTTVKPIQNTDSINNLMFCVYTHSERLESMFSSS